MNYKRILSGVLAATIMSASYGYQNTDIITCINADDATEDVKTNNSETFNEVTYSIYITEEGMLGENIRYSLDSSGVLRISGEGRMNNFEESPFKNPEKIKAVLFEDQEKCAVENIGDNTFNGCINLYGITIPQTVTEIGTYAFSECKSITEMTVPDSVTRVGEYAFKDCSALKKAVLGKGLTKVGTSSAEFFMFSGCYELEELSLPSLVTGEDTFEENENGKQTLKHSIGQVNKLFDKRNVFTSNYIQNSIKSRFNLKKITVTSGEQIFPYEFAGINVEEICLPDTIKTISEHSFDHCKYLLEINIPDSVTYIGERAFSDCKLLKKLVMGKGIEEIETFAFSGCENNMEIYFDGTEEEWYDLPDTPFSTNVFFKNNEETESDNKGEINNPQSGTSIEKILEEGILGEKVNYVLYDNGRLIIGGT